jgi:hypothetical protein
MHKSGKEREIPRRFAPRDAGWTHDGGVLSDGLPKNIYERASAVESLHPWRPFLFEQ